MWTSLCYAGWGWADEEDEYYGRTDEEAQDLENERRDESQDREEMDGQSDEAEEIDQSTEADEMEETEEGS